MRTLKSFFALIITVIALQVSFATPTTTIDNSSREMLVQTSSNTTNSVALRFMKGTADKYTIHLKDAMGQVHYFEKVKNQQEYYRTFQLENLANGQYHFSIQAEDIATIIKKFNLENGVVTLVKANEVFTVNTIATMPTLNVHTNTDKSISFQCDNNTVNNTVLHLKDEAGKTWYFMKVKAGTACAQKLSLEDLPDGHYYLIISGSEHRRTQNLKIQDGNVSIISSAPRA